MLLHRARRSAVWVLLVAVSLPDRSFAQYVDLPGTQPGGLASGSALESATPCGIVCHFSGDLATPSAMPYDHYVGSMMGNTMRDPLFLAALTVADQDRPGIGDYCLRCHTPPGFVGGRTRGTPGAPRGTDLIATDLEGVSCDSCHRMTPPSNLGNAQYEYSPTETRFGPYDMVDSIRHPGAASPLFDQSLICGTCHQITNPTQPLRRSDGSDTGQRFPLDTTYDEWAHSDFAVTGSATARTCQDCHMPDFPGQTYVASGSTAMLRDHPGVHTFAGANAWALRVLEAMRTDVASGDFYDPSMVPYYEDGAMRAEAMQQRAVALEIRSAPMIAAAGDSVHIVARITNQSGHRVPTGYVDGRRVWLTVETVDAAGHTGIVSGAYDDANARLDETDPQLHLYVAEHGRYGTGATPHLALNDTIVRDTRLPPAGFRPPAGEEPVGADYTGGAGGSLRNWDDAQYILVIPPNASGALTVRVRARYQSTTRAYVEFLASENHTDDRGRDLLARYQASGRDAPSDMAQATATIMVMPQPVDAGTDAPTNDIGGRDGGTMPGHGCGCRVRGARGAHNAIALLGVLAAMVGARRRLVRAGAAEYSSRVKLAERQRSSGAPRAIEGTMP